MGVTQATNRLAVIGGVGCVAVGAMLSALLAIDDDTDPNLLSLSTILLGAIGGILGATSRRYVWRLVLAIALVLLSIAPTLIGGVFLLYLPFVILLVVATVQDARARSSASVGLKN